MTKLLSIIMLFITCVVNAGEIRGTFYTLGNETIELYGYDYFNKIKLAETKTDSLGNFVITYDTEYVGAAELSCPSVQGAYHFILAEPTLEITGESPAATESIVLKNSEENSLLNTFVEEETLRTGLLSAWEFLQKSYETNPALAQKPKELQKSIQTEIGYLENERENYFQRNDKSLYVSWLLPLQYLMQQMQKAPLAAPQKIPFYEEAFKNLDLTDPRHKTSGLFDILFKSYYYMLENSGGTTEERVEKVNSSVDHIMANVSGNDSLTTAMTEYLFSLFEQRSYFESVAYLSEKMLQNSHICKEGSALSNKLESYCKMKTGNTAPNIEFLSKDIYGEIDTTTLDDLGFKYTLLVFGTSHDETIRNELNKLASLSSAWKEKGVEVVYISLDTDLSNHLKLAQDLPFLTYCSTLGRDDKAAKDYCIFETPAMFLLDNQRKILLKPNSAEHFEVWQKRWIK